MLDTHSHFALIDSIPDPHVCHGCAPVMTDAQLHVCEVLGKVGIRRCQSVYVYVCVL